LGRYIGLLKNFSKTDAAGKYKSLPALTEAITADAKLSYAMLMGEL